MESPKSTYHTSKPSCPGRCRRKDYEPVFTVISSHTDEQKEKDRLLAIGTAAIKNKLLHHKRGLQAYVKDNLDRFGYVDINENMFYP
uniref:Uncharacterized protein n=1 Tax=Oryza rufipogon TaxID=4529 RepID=A0A0E0R8C6_ORYRU